MHQTASMQEGRTRRRNSFALTSVAARRLTGVLMILIPVVGCNRGGNEPSAPLSIHLASTSVRAGVLDRAFTCEGRRISPELSWSAPPVDTRSFAFVATDRDSPFGYNFVHWVVYNIPANIRELAAEASSQGELPDRAQQGLNDDDKLGYAPPCPPRKSAHRYDFVLYAVDIKLSSARMSKKQLLNSINGHVLAKGELIARYTR